MKFFTPPVSFIEVFHSTILLHRKKLNIFTYSIWIGNLDWCKCGHCKNEARDIDCLYCREVDAMLIASVKIPEREGSISLSSFYGRLPDY